MIRFCLPNIIISITQKLAKNIDGHNSKASISLDLQNRKHRLVENRISDILCRVRIGCNLGGRKRKERTIVAIESTCAKMSFMVSLACASPLPSRRNKRRILTCKNGSVIPETSCSGLYPVVTRDLRFLTSRGTA